MPFDFAKLAVFLDRQQNKGLKNVKDFDKIDDEACKYRGDWLPLLLLN